MIHRLVARVSGPDAVERVRAALVRLYEQDPRFALVDDPSRAWIVWRLRPYDGGVSLVSSEVDLFEEASIGRDLGPVLGAEVVPAGAADRALAAVASGSLLDLDDAAALDDDPEPPDVPRADDVVVPIGHSASTGAGRIVRRRVTRGERVGIDAVRGAHIRKWLDLGVDGGPIRSFRVRFTGAMVELLAFEGAEVRVLRAWDGSSAYDLAAVAPTISPDGWVLDVTTPLDEGRELELHLGLYTKTLGKGTGAMTIESDGGAFEIGVDLKISRR
jgi:hypothetical protein